MGFAFEDLVVYQKAVQFGISIIDMIDELKAPRKHYRLIEQLEASCTSVALNIAEGKGRYSKKEFVQFLYISRGSLYETIAMLQILNKKEWLNVGTYEKLYSQAEEIAKMLSVLIKSIRESQL